MKSSVSPDPMKIKLQNNVRGFAGLLTCWTILLLLMRLGEWLINGWTHQFPENAVGFLSYALLSDFLFICRFGLFLLIIFLLISLVSLKAAKIFFIILCSLLTLGYFALQKYFSSTMVLLGADLYGYSIKDIQQTVGASGGLNIAGIAVLILLIAGLIFIFRWATKKIVPGFIISLVLVILLIAGSLFTFQPSLSREYDNNLAQNKLGYFLDASYHHFFPAPHELDIYSDAYSGYYEEAGNENAADIASFNYVNETEFPFLHADSTSDVLSPFLRQTDKVPNIVIILVEGLGRAFTNEGAYLGNFTPFLDSLSQHSLYWENFLSGGGRTFAVLPSVIGSLPFGKNGFNELKEKMPDHLSLVSLLKKNGYSTSFFYSGDASFDNMDLFMRKQEIDKIADKKTFPPAYPLLPANNGFSWGYGDKELYRYFLESSAKEYNAAPSLSIMLTVSTHSPFLIANQDAYGQLFDRRLEMLTLTEKQRTEARNYRQQYSTVLYADESLKDFFKQYSQRPDYANTIFLITGDHRMPEIPMSSKIDRYHVPLIVFSPLLERSAKFQSVSSHFDITPSLLAFLKQNYQLQIPSLASWMGSGLDTARAFRNIHSQALMQTKTDIIDFIKGPYHLNGDNLFRLTSTMQEEPVSDEAIKSGLRGNFDRYLQKNDQILQGRRLEPDSLMKNYYPR